MEQCDEKIIQGHSGSRGPDSRGPKRGPSTMVLRDDGAYDPVLKRPWPLSWILERIEPILHYSRKACTIPRHMERPSLCPMPVKKTLYSKMTFRPYKINWICTLGFQRCLDPMAIFLRIKWSLHYSVSDLFGPNDSWFPFIFFYL